MKSYIMSSVNFLYVFLFLYACSPVSHRNLTKTFTQAEKKFQDHIGFMLYDPVLKKDCYQFNADKYFIPASNTKILTFYASLKIMGDSIPALRFVTSGDSLIFWGTGDPSFLYKNIFNNNRVFDFFKSRNEHLYFSPSNFGDKHFGRGWAWDDYSDSYSPEKYSLPIYGNILSAHETNQGIAVTPSFFNNIVITTFSQQKKSTVKRRLTSNQLEYSQGSEIKKTPWDIPFSVDSLLIASLLQDTLKKPVSLISKPIPSTTNTLFSLPTDSLYKIMMQQSDNFIAEQLLLTCAGIVSDTLKTEIAIKYVQKNYFQDLTDKPVWVDGSGLSRYNLFTPRSIVQVWEKIYNELARKRLFDILAVGGKSGTLKNSYAAETPYIFGKTGTLSNNHNLSGYLVTRRGRVLIFSFMNNNHPASAREVRKNMETILASIRDNY